MERNITTLLAVEAYIQGHTREIRKEKVLTDLDVAGLYEVSIEELHKTVNKNKSRFPSDFMFLLDEEEKKELSLTGKKVYAFTQAGILMLGGQLRSDRAIKTHMQLIELFVGEMPGKVFEILSNLQNQKK